MRILSLEITNWGPHKKKSFNFDAGIVGIIGANGKGKSNLLQAIDYALTGNLNKQKQESYIHNYGLPDGASSASVKLSFEKGGKHGEITRTITATGSRRKLIWDDTEWTKAADVEKAMETILGADKASLAQAVFVKQGDLARIVKGTPAERQTIFQKLMNLGFLDQHPDDINAKIGAIRGSLQDMRPALELALQDRATAVATQEELKPAMLEASTLRLDIADLENISSAIADVELTKTKVSEAVFVRTKLQEAYYAQINKLKEHGDDIPAINASVARIRQEITEIEKQLQAWTQYEVWQSRVDKAKTQLATLNEQRSGYTSSSALQAELDSISAMLSEATGTANWLRSCQTYYSQVKTAQAALGKAQAEAQTAIDIADAQLPVLREQLQTLTKEQEDATVKLSQLDAKLVVCTSSAETSLCPICGTHFTVDSLLLPGETVEQGSIRMRLERTTVANQLNTIKRSIKSCLDQINAHEEAKRCVLVEAKKADLERAKQQLLIMDPDGKYNEGDLEFNTSMVTSLTTKVATLRATQSTVEALDRNISEMESQLAMLQQPGTCPEIVLIPVADLRAKHLDLVGLETKLLSVVQSYNDAYKLLYDAQTREDELLGSRSHKEDILVSMWSDIETHDSLVQHWLMMDPEEKLNRSSLADVNTVIAGLREMLNEAAQAEAKYTQLEQQIHALDMRIAELQNAVNANAEKLKLIDDLNVVKSMVSRTGVPLAFMSDVFHKLTGLVQDLLSRMGANFNVIPDPERACSFLFTRTDDDSGFTMKQEQLSGGQAIRLALAMLLACQQLVLPEVGLLVLDEPSSHIDREGVRQMRDMFMSLQQIMVNSDMQLVIVDHNDQLATAFETTVML